MSCSPLNYYLSSTANRRLPCKSGQDVLVIDYERQTITPIDHFDNAEGTVLDLHWNSQEGA
jgi:hypothetical protein